MSPDLANRIGIIVEMIVTMVAAFLVAFWLGLAVWTFRDIRARSRDPLAVLLATLLVLAFGPVGVLLYLLLRPKETLAEQYDRALEEEALLREIEELHLCPGCRRPTHPDWQLCPYCHTPLRQPCPHCDRLVDLNWTVCPFCTADLAPSVPAPEPGLPSETREEAPEEMPQASPIPLEHPMPESAGPTPVERTR